MAIIVLYLGFTLNPKQWQPTSMTVACVCLKGPKVVFASAGIESIASMSDMSALELI